MTLIMSGAKKSVDEIWKELNARTVAPRSRTTGITGFGIPGIQTHTRVVPRQHLDITQQHKHVAEDVSINRDVPKPAVAYDPAAAGVQPEELQRYVSTLQRTLNCLTDPDRSTRRAAIIALHSKLLCGDASTPKASPEMLQALLAGPLLHPLTTLLSDPLEKCRLTALQLLVEAAPHLADPGVIMTGLLPQMVARMGRVPVQEPAEEVRLAGLKLVQELIQKTATSVLTSASEDICLILARGFEDPFPDAKKEAAATLKVLAERLPDGALETQAEKLLQALLPNLSHQHSKVRLAMLSGLRSLVLSGLPAGMISADLAPAIKPLGFDRAALVRETYYSAVASWLGCDQQQQQQGDQIRSETRSVDHDQLRSSTDQAVSDRRSRCRTHAPALLPLLLLGVSDEQQSIAAAALAAVEQAGVLWQQQQQHQGVAAAETDRNSAVPMETDTQLPAAAAAAAGVAEGAAADGLPPAAAAAVAVAAAQLPPPFQGLPNSGCRQMVSDLLPHLLPGILAGLKEWTNTLRSAAARTFHTTLVLAGSAATPYLQPILSALIISMSEEDISIVTLLASSCRVLGAFVPCNAWLPIIVDALTDQKSGNISKANALVVTSCLIHAAAAAQQQPDPKLLDLLVSALVTDEIRCSDHVGIQQQLLAVVANLLNWMTAEAAAAAGQQLYLILLQLHGAFAADQTTAAAAAPQQQQQQQQGSIPHSSRARHVMQLLAFKLQMQGFSNLADSYAGVLLPLLTTDAASWTAGSSNLRAMMSLMQTADAKCLGALLPEVVKVFHPMLSDHDRDAALRLNILRLLDGLMEDSQTAAAFGGSNAGLVMRDLIMPPLVWRAGKAAAAVRFQALTALCTLISCKLAPQEVLLAAAAPAGGLLPLLAQSLDEDWYSDVRHTACYVVQLILEQVGSLLSDEARRAIYPEVLKRLDDSSNKVRIAACAALSAFIESAGSSYCSTNTGYLAAGVVLHMDDGDQEVAEAACKVMAALAITHPDVAAAEINKVQDRFRAKHYCERVLRKASEASGRQQQLRRESYVQLCPCSNAL